MANPCIKLLKEFNHLSPTNIEELMEYLEDTGLLNKKGKSFRHKFWEMFIKE